MCLRVLARAWLRVLVCACLSTHVLAFAFVCMCVPACASVWLCGTAGVTVCMLVCTTVGVLVCVRVFAYAHVCFCVCSCARLLQLLRILRLWWGCLVTHVHGMPFIHVGVTWNAAHVEQCLHPSTCYRMHRSSPPRRQGCGDTLFKGCNFTNCDRLCKLGKACPCTVL